MLFDRGFKRRSFVSAPVIKLSDEAIDVVTSFKYLGIWIDNRLKFNVHLDACIRNGNHKIYMLRKIRNCMDQKTASLVYKSMILPILEYGNCFLLGCSSVEKTKIQRTQNKGLKIVFMRDRLYNTKQLHKDANLASWEARALTASCRLMFKYEFFPSYIELPISIVVTHLMMFVLAKIVMMSYISLHLILFILRSLLVVVFFLS